MHKKKRKKKNETEETLFLCQVQISAGGVTLGFGFGACVILIVSVIVVVRFSVVGGLRARDGEVFVRVDFLKHTETCNHMVDHDKLCFTTYAIIAPGC